MYATERATWSREYNAAVADVLKAQAVALERLVQAETRRRLELKDEEAMKAALGDPL